MMETIAWCCGRSTIGRYRNERHSSAHATCATAAATSSAREGASTRMSGASLTASRPGWMVPSFAVRIAARRRFGAFDAAVVLFVGLVFFAHVVRIVEPFGVDQGLFACFTRWVPRGWLPYRDLFDSKPPLFLYSYALAGLVPGELARAIWWVEAAFLAGSLFLAFALGRERWSRWTGLACAALLFLALWSPAWGGFWSRAQAEELLALPMLGSAWLALRAIDRHPLAAWAGVLAGICGLYKIPSMAIAGAWAVTWLLTGRPAAALGRAALLACGIAIPWLLTVIWFGAHHALPDFVAGVFVYHRYNAAFISPPWLDVVVDFASA